MAASEHVAELRVRMKGFSDEWCALMDSFVSGGSVAIKVNDDTGKFFQTKKGLRQIGRAHV